MRISDWSSDVCSSDLNTTDLVNRLEMEVHQGRTGKLAEHLSRLDLLIIDELGYLPFARAGGQLLFHLVSRLYETIGRASSRERVCQSVEISGVAVSLKKQQQQNSIRQTTSNIN